MKRRTFISTCFWGAVGLWSGKAVAAVPSGLTWAIRVHAYNFSHIQRFLKEHGFGCVCARTPSTAWPIFIWRLDHKVPSTFAEPGDWIEITDGVLSVVPELSDI